MFQLHKVLDEYTVFFNKMHVRWFKFMVDRKKLEKRNILFEYG